MSLLISLELSREHFNLNINTAIETQGFSAVYGPSGSGKTTLLRWLAGLEKNTVGHLTFNREIWQSDTFFKPTQQREIAYVFQDARLFPHLDVLGNLNYAYQRRFNDNGPSIQQVTEWFALKDLLSNNCSHLSGGEQQRVAIARALLTSPQLILMDEPLGSLDRLSKQHILHHLEQLHQHLVAPVIYVSHDLEEVSRLADNVVLLDDGNITAQGPLLELSSRLDLPLSHEESAASIVETTVHQHDERYHLTELLINDRWPLFVATIDVEKSQRVRVRIPARDVSITLTQPENSSIQNIIPATIEAIEHAAGARALIRLQVGEQKLLVRLTNKSVEQLQLAIGQSVFAQIKTVALLSDLHTSESK